MKVTVTLKCDRSGRTEDILIDSTDIAQYEERQAKREETLKKIHKFIAAFTKDELPDLFAVYRGEVRSFANVSTAYCDKPVKRLLDQLFHASNPAKRGKGKKKTNAGNNNNAKTAKNAVKDKASAKSSSAKQSEVSATK